ncbi:proton-coupled amino acid transporter 1-like isoform X3 [Drosophila gunungcola]|uniref:proton-coupled amino acid transporter 1-like isoform X3 n=1 Tax=Drosophila gunungcola TaxID=103775 RepID=UPI0022E14B49|nr:proton-coupled amino acid transporter 1-like isoform X3 [Drosophila gunungcola]
MSNSSNSSNNNNNMDAEAPAQLEKNQTATFPKEETVDGGVTGETAPKVIKKEDHDSEYHPPTSYLETIVHLFKGNIGPGLFAMGDAFKNGGLLVAPLLTVVIAVVSIHCQHVLVTCSKKMRDLRGDSVCADYAQTVEQCFENGPPKLRGWSRTMGRLVDIFICVTQLGFCCIYFVFISTNLKQILQAYDIDMNVHLVMLLAFVPVLLSSLITNLKWLTPVSMFANVCMILGLAITLYYALKDGLPGVEERALWTNGSQLALFFGTAIFAFEGIALVMPLKNAMRKPHQFERPLGVLNVGMFLVSVMFMFAGSVGYMKWGEQVGGSLTLNLGDTILAQAVKLMVSTGVLLGYPLQFFVAIQIMWPNAKQMCGIKGRSLIGELGFRTFMVLVTLAIAEMVPALGLFISLIGALCSTALALVFPPVIELIARSEQNKGPGVWICAKNLVILVMAMLGFFTGSYESLKQIVKHFGEEELH